ncbi:MAG: DUF2945 domain-containing protein [Xanthobacteraceae bacterium]
MLDRAAAYPALNAFSDPQYEIKSDKTDHVAMHKGSALKRIVN